MFNVSGRMSMNTGVAPRRAKAFIVVTNVKEGTMTSSPGWMSNNSAAISSACVQDVVRNALGTPSHCSSKAWHFLVNGPSPEIRPFATACLTYSISLPIREALLNGIVFFGILHLLLQESRTRNTPRCRDHLPEWPRAALFTRTICGTIGRRM